MQPLDVPTREGRLSFAELGEEFMRTVLTTDLLVAEFMGAIPAGGLEASETVNGFVVDYSARVLNVTAKRNKITRLHPQPAVHGLRFHFNASFQLRLNIAILGGLRENFEISGSIPIMLEAQVYQPLELYIAYEKLKEEQIELATEKGQWHDLAHRFGGLEDKVRKKIVERVNSLLHENEAYRRINLLQMIEAALVERARSRA